MLIIIVLFTSCNDDSNTKKQVDVLSIPQVEIVFSELELAPNQGLYLLKEKPFTGIAIKKYTNGNIAEKIAFAKGKKNSTHFKYFEDATKSFEAQYVYGKREGIVKTWWQNGKKRSQSTYVNGNAEGKQYQWYRSGKKFKEINLVDGKEEGLQRSWRENGKIYNNYEAKNGRIFGLKRATLCFQLDDEELQTSIR